ncbi:MAG: DsbA family oxidoreductase [Paracoccaceae bacterium]
MIKLDILSDPICPWCYIGKANLDRALAEHPEHPFVIEWHPFQLNPNMPAGGVDRRSYLETKFGGQDGAIQVYARIDTAAKAAGLDINWAGITRTPNTMNAHRLIHWAGLAGRQNAVVAGLFAAYFMHGRDIGEVDVLADLAAGAGMDRAMVAQLFDGDGDTNDIAGRDAHSRERGVSGVPTFVVNNQAVMSGAQPPELWAEIISDFRADQVIH